MRTYVISRSEPSEAIFNKKLEDFKFIQYFYRTSITCDWEYLGVFDEALKRIVKVDDDRVGELIEANVLYAKYDLHYDIFDYEAGRPISKEQVRAVMCSICNCIPTNFEEAYAHIQCAIKPSHPFLESNI